MIELNNLSLARDGITLLDGITMSVTDGETVGIIGPSGSGKSLLLKIIAGEAGGYTGSVSRGTTARGKPSPAYLMPARSPRGEYDTLRNFVLSSRLAYRRGLRGYDTADRNRADECISWFELGPYCESGLGGLSDGILMRAMLARAFAGEHPVTMLDNPTSSLDVRGAVLLAQAMVRHLIDGNSAVILATVDINFAAQTCDRIIALHAGKIVREGTPDIIDPELVRELYGTGVLVSRNIYNGRPQVHLFHEP